MRRNILATVPRSSLVMMGVDSQRCIWIASHAVPCCQPRISLAARPAIMWVDALVPGPAMICGITEASATRKPVMPCVIQNGHVHPSCGIDEGRRCGMRIFWAADVYGTTRAAPGISAALPILLIFENRK